MLHAALVELAVVGCEPDPVFKKCRELYELIKDMCGVDYLTTGNSILDAYTALRSTVIIGSPVAGTLANSPASAPAMATRNRYPALSTTEVGCRPNVISVTSGASPGPQRRRLTAQLSVRCRLNSA